MAQEYYLQYPAAAFEPMDEGYQFSRAYLIMFLSHSGPSGGWYFHTVNFNKPHSQTLFIKNIAIKYEDNDPTYDLTVKLMRKNLFTNAVHTVATWTSSGAVGDLRGASQGTIAGTKVVDSIKFVY